MKHRVDSAKIRVAMRPNGEFWTCRMCPLQSGAEPIVVTRRNPVDATMEALVAAQNREWDGVNWV